MVMVEKQSFLGDSCFLVAREVRRILYEVFHTYRRFLEKDHFEYF
jgi:hypothetical protein